MRIQVVGYFRVFGTNCTMILKSALCNWESLTPDTMWCKWRKSRFEGLSGHRSSQRGSLWTCVQWIPKFKASYCLWLGAEVCTSLSMGTGLGSWNWEDLWFPELSRGLNTLLNSALTCSPLLPTPACTGDRQGAAGGGGWLGRFCSLLWRAGDKC